jgi:hypothetical protein
MKFKIQTIECPNQVGQNFPWKKEQNVGQLRGGGESVVTVLKQL